MADQSDGPGGREPNRSPRLGVVVEGLRVLVSALAGLVSVAAVGGVGWLGWRSWVVAGLGSAVLGVIWWPSGGRGGAVLAGLSGVAGGVVAATGLGRVAQGEAVPGRSHGAGMADRILGRDLPPPAVYVVVVAALLLVVVCVALALPWRARAARVGRGGLGAGILGGVLASALATAAVVGVAAEARAFADDRAEADAVTATTSRTAGRIDAGGGPTRPTEQAWRIGPAPSDDAAERVRGLVAVPGWDVVVTYSERARLDAAGFPEPGTRSQPIVARSKRDGSELWRYWRHDRGVISGVAVDPDAGRVLVVTGGLLAGGAAVVLDLEDGSELAARPLPAGLGDPVLLDDRFTEAGSHDGAGATLGPAAVVWDFHGGDALGVIDVATGDVLGTVTTPSSGCVYAAVTATSSPVIVQWGQGGACGGPQLIRLDGRRLVGVDIDIDDLDDEAGLEGCGGCVGGTNRAKLAVTDHAILVSLGDPTSDGPSDLVALSPAGDVRWRLSETGATAGSITEEIVLVAVSEQGVVAQWGGELHRLSLADGTERARQARCGDGYYFAADGERIYTPCDGLAVLRVDDLTVVSEGGPQVEWLAAFPADGYFIALQDGADRSVVALTDP